MDENGFKPTWSVDKTIKGTYISVEVQKSDHRRPRYSLSYGESLNDRGRLRPFITMRSFGKGRISLERSIAEDLRTVTMEAEEYVVQQLQAAEDAWVASLEGREKKFDKKGPVVRVTGKTERNRARGKANPLRST